MKVVARILLKLLGWRIVVDFPPDLKKFVVAVAPHTSWMDFPIGLLVRATLNRRIYYLGKKELFDGPLGFFFRWTGGKPVDRKNKSGLVEQVASLFKEQDSFAIALAPEGTRNKVTDFRTGFYYIAKAAEVPVIPCLFDYEHKTIHFLPPFYPSENAEADLDALWQLYAGIKGAKPAHGISGPRKAGLE